MSLKKEDLKGIRKAHKRYRRGRGKEYACEACGMAYPCTTIQLLDYIKKLYQIINAPFKADMRVPLEMKPGGDFGYYDPKKTKGTKRRKK